MKIITNGQPRLTIDWYDLTEKERGEFNYIDTRGDADSASFFRYKGEVYALGEFTAVDHSNLDTLGFHDWDGISPESFFSGIVIKFLDEHLEEVVVGRYFT